jgi:stage III sporulation protein AA
MISEILKVLPIRISKELENIGARNGINEIRLRVGRKGVIISSGQEFIMSSIIGVEDLLEILIRVSKNSIYAIQNDINNGFVVIKGGHRIGICGEVVLQDGKIKNIKNINSMNIRVARQLVGCSDKIMPYIVECNNFNNTLIVSPPGCGKTTMLRDAIRQISNGIEILKFKGLNVGLVDERGEIACVSCGISNLDVGNRTDIISNCPKNIGMEMLVRSMGISVIATDEIGSKQDVEAIKFASLSGVGLIFTMHGRSLEEILKKDGICELINENLFKNAIFLSNRNGPGTIETIHKFSDNKREVI